jgi:hypothetical protein
MRSGEPLDEYERFSLDHLPPEWFTAASANWPSAEMPTLALRNPTLEQFCKLTETAYHEDLTGTPQAILDWNVAAAVLKVKHHPLSLLLQAVGITEERPWWDKWLLIAAGLLLVFLLVLFGMVFSDNTAALLCGFAVAVGLSYLASRWLEKRRLKQAIERGRRPARNT